MSQGNSVSDQSSWLTSNWHIPTTPVESFRHFQVQSRISIIWNVSDDTWKFSLRTVFLLRQLFKICRSRNHRGTRLSAVILRFNCSYTTKEKSISHHTQSQGWWSERNGRKVHSITEEIGSGRGLLRFGTVEGRAELGQSSLSWKEHGKQIETGDIDLWSAIAEVRQSENSTPIHTQRA